MMATFPTSRWLQLAERVYRASLLLYPAGFRRVYRTEMLQTFRAACRETWQEEGRTGLLRLASRSLAFSDYHRQADRFRFSLACVGCALPLAGV